MLTILANIMGTLATWMMILVGFGGLLLLLVALIGVAV